MLTPDAMRYFNQWCGETFGAGYTFHSMRHTHATLLLEAGEDLELVSKRLGHGSINTTAQTYFHVLDTRKQKTRTLLDQSCKKRCHSSALSDVFSRLLFAAIFTSGSKIAANPLQTRDFTGYSV